MPCSSTYEYDSVLRFNSSIICLKDCIDWSSVALKTCLHQFPPVFIHFNIIHYINCMKPYTLHNTGYNGSVIHAVSFKNKIRAYCISTAKLDPTVYFVWQIHFTRRWILSYKSVAVFTISLCSEYVKTDMKIFTQRCQLFIN